MGSLHHPSTRYSFQKLPNYFSGTRYFFFSTLIKSKIPNFVLACEIKSAISVRIFVEDCDFKVLPQVSIPVCRIELFVLFTVC